MKKQLTILLLLFIGIQSFIFASDNSLEKVQKQGYFLIGLDDNFAPMGFRDKNGEIAGFDIDLAKEVAKRMGVEARFKACDWDGIIFELRSKKIDLIWNGLTITEQRKKQIAFSNPYFEGKQVIVTKAGSSIKDISDLKGQVVGLQLGSTSMTALESNPVSKDVKDIKKYGTNVEALLDLEAGRINAVVIDSMVGEYYISQKEKAENKNIFNKLNQGLDIEQVGIGMRKGDDTLRIEINKRITELKNDGTYSKIQNKWFGGITKDAK